MKKLSKEQCAKVLELQHDLDQEAQRIEELVIHINETIRNKLNGAIEAYNAVVEEINEFIGAVTKEMDTYIEAQPEDWENKDEGSNYIAWKEDWDNSTMDDLPTENELDVNPVNGNFLEELPTLPD